MFVDTFVKRPVLAIVCATVILLVGVISIPLLPVEQYPDISPVQVVVSAEYVGASAQVVEDTITTVLERQINGVEGMRYMSSTSSNDGASTITVTFKPGYDKNIAAIDVQNRVSLAEPQLPPAVRQSGISVTKQSTGSIIGIALFSDPEGQYDRNFISNYADLYVIDILKRIEGVGAVRTYGERRYAMRLWLDPNRLASRLLTAQDVVDALNQQNLQVGAGRIGQPPAMDGQMYQIDLQVQGRLQEVAEFENLILKTGADGALVKLKDVGRAELGAEDYNSFARYRGRSAVGYEIYRTPGSNALETANAIKAELARLAKDFPPGLKYGIPYDPTLFVVESRQELVNTLLAAIALVVIVLFIFLQDWRAALIPAVTIPVSLIGTFAFVKAFGFSLNSLTFFGLILATGMVVDDAIIVVEDIARWIQEKRVEPSQAAASAMRELFGAVIATSLVLMAVFVPVAFFPGTTGQMYRQFALTIAFAIALSTFLALTLTPALSSLLLRGRQEPSGCLGWGFARINWLLDLTRRAYWRMLTQLVRYQGIVLLLFIICLGLTGWLYQNVPTSFLPDEDQGYSINIVQGPEGASLEYTDQVIRQMDTELQQIPEIASTFSVGGFSPSGTNIANNGIGYALFHPWGERKQPEQTASAIIEQSQELVSPISEATVLAISPPAIEGLGSVGGFVFQLQDRGNNSIDTLVQVRDELIERANQTPQLQDVFSTYNANAPQLRVEVDRDRAEALGVAVDEIFSTLEVFLGSRYINDFNAFGRTYRVYVQADQQFRSHPEQIGQLYVRSVRGEVIPLSNLVRVTPTTGPQTISHYNLFRSIEVNGNAAPGFSSGQAIQAMERIAAEILPNNIRFEWSGISLEEIQSSGQALLIFSLGAIFVFLVLAAQYGNFIDPLIIMLSVPLAVLGALLAQSLRGLSNDIYCQVGLVMLIGLASKNAILIVEFANQLREQGFSVTKAAIEAAQERLRPILMTAISTLLGVWPLVMAAGAGAVSRRSLGTAVFSGMLVATCLSLFVVPILYIAIGKICDRTIRASSKPKAGS